MMGLAIATERRMSASGLYALAPVQRHSINHCLSHRTRELIPVIMEAKRYMSYPHCQTTLRRRRTGRVALRPLKSRLRNHGTRGSACEAGNRWV